MEFHGARNATIGRRILNGLRSVKLALSLLVLIGAAMIVATVIRNQTAARRYIYHSWWFISLLGLFCLNLILCTTARWSFRLRKLGTNVTHAGVLVMVAGVLVGAFWGERGFLRLYIGHSDNACYANKERLVVQLVDSRWDGTTYDTEQAAKSKQAEYESKNLGVQLFEQEGKFFLYTSRVTDVQSFPVRVGKRFKIAGTPYSVSTLCYVPDFVVLGSGVYGSRSRAPRNPAILVNVENGFQKSIRWVFANAPGMHQDPNSGVRLFYRRTRKISLPFTVHLQDFEVERYRNRDARGKIKAFKSKVQLRQGEKIVASKTIEVNKPLKYKGYAIYQSSYDPAHEAWSELEIAKDPGVNIVYLGFVLISAGVLFTFYVRPILTKERSVEPSEPEKKETERED